MTRTNSDTSKLKVSILGAGPAGIAAAYALGKENCFGVQVVESSPKCGGNSSSFQMEGIWCDFGSHRFHPVADAHVLDDVKSLLGDDLLLQPRHGRIRLGGRWIHFPLKITDAILRLPKSFAASLIGDSLLKPFRAKSSGPPTFSSVLYDGLGRTISENFYFPYVKKLWGLDPDELAVKLAERRVSGSSVWKILLKMARMLPGLRAPTTGRFYYPKSGFGQISTAMAARAEELGAEFCLNSRISRIARDGDKVTGVFMNTEKGEAQLETDVLLSTIPITTLVNLMDPPPPPAVMEAAKAIRYRGMILLYLILETDQFTEFDAHYFPELSIPISRMSEPKNYNSAIEPKGLTILCAELPCDPDDPWWNMSDEELGQKFCEWLDGVNLPVTVPVRRCETRRLSHAYPVYDLEFQSNFDTMDAWLLGLEGLLNFGRQGLFAHDNTHHAFAMAYGAVDCVGADGSIDHRKWAVRRAEFAAHTVED